jgi:hypothetical protein
VDLQVLELEDCRHIRFSGQPDALSGHRFGMFSADLDSILGNPRKERQIQVINEVYSPSDSRYKVTETWETEKVRLVWDSEAEALLSGEDSELGIASGESEEEESEEKESEEEESEEEESEEEESEDSSEGDI